MKQKNSLLCQAGGSRRPFTAVEAAKAYYAAVLGRTRLEGTHAKVQMAQTATRLDISVIEVLRKILNEERAEGVIEKKNVKDYAISSALAKNDCRIFKRLITFSALRSSSSFLFESNCGIQCDTLFALRDLFNRNDYRPIWKEIGRQYELCVNTHEEFKKLIFFKSLNVRTVLCAHY